MGLWHFPNLVTEPLIDFEIRSVVALEKGGARVASSSTFLLLDHAFFHINLLVFLPYKQSRAWGGYRK